ncbi:LINE-1 retrotransposable element ORF1 protein [Dissostichus eleginoides]|uniref:LINE-1 retrotransposable element ORF1 protein n=1 Tax=Dissostichus eleginoides TaxID=100907 RepID=A0AAD9B8D7_DISEL|nr:LINE-1 retrotransposable element ORF1 protein [Dissostichus eleginoides]
MSTLHSPAESSGSRKEKERSTVEDCSLSIYEDLTKERSDLRRRFSLTMKTLWEHQVKHTLAHPANLRFTWKGKRWSFIDPKKAEEFVGKNIHTTEGHE